MELAFKPVEAASGNRGGFFLHPESLQEICELWMDVHQLSVFAADTVPISIQPVNISADHPNRPAHISGPIAAA